MESMWSRALRALYGLRSRADSGNAGGGLSWLGRGGGEKHRTGWRAEEFAAGHLTGLGYHVLGRNVVIGPGEIDIVAEHRRRLVFIEVRSRREGSAVRPSSTLTAEKSERVIACGESYMESRGLKPEVVKPRYDIAEVYLDHAGRPRRVVILEAAVTPRYRR